jgi:hypothetical protein
MGLETENTFEEVNTLFERVYKIYEQRHNEVDYNFLNYFVIHNCFYIKCNYFLSPTRLGWLQVQV